MMTDLPAAPATTRTVLVPEERWDSFMNRFADFNKKAKKCGVSPATYVETGKELVKVLIMDNMSQHIPAIRIELTYTVPVLSGWSVMASVEAGPLGLIVKGPHSDSYKHLRSDTLRCDHCGHNRNRNNHFIVKNDGQELMVGSTCLKDFVGHSPAPMLSLMSSFSDLEVEFYDDEKSGSFTGSFQFRDVEDIVKHTVRQIRQDGGKYIKRDDFGMNLPTIQSVMNSLFPPMTLSAEEREYLKVTDADSSLSAKVIERLTHKAEEVKQNRDAASDYDYKVASAVINGFCSFGRKTDATFGPLVASVFFTMNQIQREEFALAPKVDNPTEKALLAARVGDKVTITGKVITVRDYENNFGFRPTTSTMVIMKVGDTKVRFFSTVVSSDLKEGDDVTVKATIKSIDNNPKFGITYNVNRPKFL